MDFAEECQSVIVQCKQLEEFKVEWVKGAESKSKSLYADAWVTWSVMAVVDRICLDEMTSTRG